MVAVNSMQISGQRTNKYLLQKDVWDIHRSIDARICGAMLSTVWFQSLFACTMIYRSSLFVVFLDRSPQIFFIATCVFWTIFQAWEHNTFANSKLLDNTRQTTPLFKFANDFSTYNGVPRISCSYIARMISNTLITNIRKCDFPPFKLPNTWSTELIRFV
ncbi:hypothetical protein TNCV_1318391 [Trichonephila clavipes]|nr:hypothetical protein TNCV_1318391 [Trichonephila clavipes]